jgi:hypothetical protein
MGETGAADEAIGATGGGKGVSAADTGKAIAVNANKNPVVAKFVNTKLRRVFAVILDAICINSSFNYPVAARFTAVIGH